MQQPTKTSVASVDDGRESSAQPLGAGKPPLPVVQERTFYRPSLLRDPRAGLSVGGFLMLYTSMGALLLILAMLYRMLLRGGPTPDVALTTAQLMSVFLPIYLPAILGLLVAALSAVLGFALLQAAGKATRLVIPPDDRELLHSMLTSDNQTGIENYIRLSSLTGISAAFTKVGLSGLPLATILLTVLFAMFALLPTRRSDTMFDLAKLTLGAFIGSYVQKQSPERRLADGSQGSKSTSGKK